MVRVGEKIFKGTHTRNTYLLGLVFINFKNKENIEYIHHRYIMYSPRNF